MAVGIIVLKKRCQVVGGWMGLSGLSGYAWVGRVKAFFATHMAVHFPGSPAPKLELCVKPSVR